MDGVLIDLLNAKWNTFVKSRFYRQFYLFCFYFVFTLVSFTLRPGPIKLEEEEQDQLTGATTTSNFVSYNETTFESTTLDDHISLILQESNASFLLEAWNISDYNVTSDIVASNETPFKKEDYNW